MRIIYPIMSNAQEKLYRIRHSMAHILAEAVTELFPDAKLAIGPPIEHGFYYDFELPRSLTPDDLQEIETRMQRIITAAPSFTPRTVSREEARALFAKQPYKLEILAALPPEEEVTVYTQNNFTDLCRGPHVESASELNAASMKLLSIAGAYWRGDENNTMLQRIYGTAWRTPKELKVRLRVLEEIAARDHRKLGKELDLFSMHDLGGAGMIYWHPKGARVRMAIEEYWRRMHLSGGYEIVYTPHIGKSKLWEKSGHLEHYTENMFAPMHVDNSDYYAKPMNCPFHIMIYNTAQRSFRDLPLRWAELGTVYRYERSGVLHGTMRVRGFTQDDAHIFCTPEQAESEVVSVLKFSLQVWKDFGFTGVQAYLATQPKKSIGDDEHWRRAEQSLQGALDSIGIEYVRDEGGGAFYGPKIDLKIRDALGREWQMSTIQFDFNLPECFDMTFVDNDGQEKRPYMIHRALLGSLERFFGILIEHHAGAFPLWLAPYQLQVIPVAEPFCAYAEEVCAYMQEHGIRAHVDVRNDRLSAKIRNAHMQKYPYLAIVGGKEAETRTITIRARGSKEQHAHALDDAVARFTEEIAQKK